ncbi:solute carrier family 23 protein [Shigella flexneri]
MITPLVSGVVVMIIGLSLIQVGLTSIGGGFRQWLATPSARKNLLLAGMVLAIIILLNRRV